MHYQLIVESGPDQGTSFELTGEKTIVVGRGVSADFRLSDTSVSRQHMAIRIDGEAMQISDCQSKAGTFLDDSKIRESKIVPGQRIIIGNSKLVVRLEREDTTRLVHPQAPSDAFYDLQSLSGQEIHNYRLDRIVSSGKSSFIYLAADVKKHRKVAFKILRSKFVKGDESSERFIRAMETMYSIRHPNIIQIYNAGVNKNHAWVAMEFFEGKPLTSLIDEIGLAGMLDWRITYRIATQIASALEYASEHSIIHRNVSPNNILYSRKEELAKLSDLILSKAIDGPHAKAVTISWKVLGDHRYLSPERLSDKNEQIDERSDLYSLGVMLYALLTGRLPHDVESATALFEQIQQAEIKKPSEFQLSVSGIFEGIVMKLLEPRPEDRFQSATKLLIELERVGKYEQLS